MILYDSFSVLKSDETTWTNTVKLLEAKLSEHSGILHGSCVRWDGTRTGTTIIEDSTDFYNIFSYITDIKLEDKRGHLYITAYHHDGTDRFEMKLLTDKGQQYYDENYVMCNSMKTLHMTLWNSRKYSKLFNIRGK